MITVTTKGDKKEISFPKLMKIDELILLCTGKTDTNLIGTVIKGSIRFPIGYHSYSWTLDNSVDFNDPITLQNQ